MRDQGTSVFVTSDSALNDGACHIVVGVCDRDNPSGLVLYVDGIRQAASADPTAIDGHDLNGTRQFAIGSRQEENGGTWFWDFLGTVGAVYVWRRALSEVEVWRLSLDPFGFFPRRAAQRRVLARGPTVVDCSGVVSAGGDAHGTISALRSVGATVEAFSAVEARVRATRPLAGAAGGRSQIAGSLTLTSSRIPGAVPVESYWMGAALFNGLTPNAFHLGLTLTQGWFWARRRGCTALYAGPEPGKIDYSHIVASGDGEASTLSLPGHLTPSAAESRCFVVRRYAADGGHEETASACAIVRMEASGDLALPAPNMIFGLRADVRGGRVVRLCWLYVPLDQGAEPQGFRVYGDAGTGSVNWGAALAEVGYTGRHPYTFETGPLDPGSYRFGVTARSAAGIESPCAAGASCVVPSGDCEPILILEARGA